MHKTELEAIRQMSDTPTIVVTLLLAVIALITSMCEKNFDID